ncbi:polysaccharide deacetylase family protein [Peribacillus alkalitolerans]|uniref:polysaccharide deacetylase family protein n=1 Tax=Peribacillus alkalitolerans TaxID=1550385 RepID=UPI0013D028C3|nr:polysaccharide deacetylase family protein [Peribacillus alkalitolerans]
MVKGFVGFVLVYFLLLTVNVEGSSIYDGTTILKDQSKYRKVAYLTFDDGPSLNTVPILDILDQEGIKATFFVMGHDSTYAMKGYKEIIKRGHVLALHTYSHDFTKIYRSSSQYFEDLHKLEDFLWKNFRVRSNIVRFPGGSKNISSRQYGPYNIMSDLETELEKKGYRIYDWNVDSKDGISPTISEYTILSSVLRGAAGKQTAIILLHDINEMKNTVRVLPNMITALKEQGFEFEVISEDVEQMQF